LRIWLKAVVVAVVQPLGGRSVTSDADSTLAVTAARCTWSGPNWVGNAVRSIRTSSAKTRFYISHPRRSREYLAQIDLIPAPSGLSMLICQGINMLRLHLPHPGACTHTNVRSATDITAGAPRRYEAMSGCRVGL